MIPHGMQTVGEFLSDCGRRLAPYERLRVGRVGCFASLGAIVCALAALALGLRDTGGSGTWGASGFRFVILCALGSVIVLFLAYAAIETMVERALWRRVEGYMRESGTDVETLFRAAEMRRTHIPGGNRLVALIRENRP